MLSSKKLKSGKVQIRFDLLQESSSSYYGYILSEGKTPLREVMNSIYMKARLLERGDSFHDHLFHLERRAKPNQDLILFKN